MNKILLLLVGIYLLSFSSTIAQITCDTSGNVVLYSNYDGGVLNINVDVNIPNLKIGVVSYEMVTINLSGPYVNNITEIQFAGYTTTTHHHCANSPAVTSIVGAPPGTDTMIFMPNSPVANNNGYYIIICNTSCDTTTNQGGCNTPDQIAAYFQQEFGGLLRYHFTQYGCWNGTFNISNGGNCCINALSPPPVAIFSALNQLCPGTCTDFLNLSTNATSYQWYFPGGNPSSSTDENPTGICYNTPGNYDVTLIATGPGGIDTIQLNNYITVFPYPPPQGIIQSGDTLFANPGAVVYQWYLNGNLIPGATDYFYVSSVTGDYNVVATDVNGCEVEAVFIGNPWSTHELNNENEIKVFPNPVTDKFTIQFRWLSGSKVKRGIALEISIYNVMGEKVMSIFCDLAPDGFCDIDCRLLPRGIYTLRFVSDQKTINTKFIKP
jgi:PKD repeat protein